MPADGLALAVGVGGDVEDVGLLGGLLQLVEDLLLGRRHHVLRLEVLLRVDAELGLRQIADVAHRGLDDVLRRPDTSGSSSPSWVTRRSPAPASSPLHSPRARVDRDPPLSRQLPGPTAQLERHQRRRRPRRLQSRACDRAPRCAAARPEPAIGTFGPRHSRSRVAAARPSTPAGRARRGATALAILTRCPASMSTSLAPSCMRRFAPALDGDVIRPGTAKTSRPRSPANPAVIRAPLRSAASTTTTPRASPASVRLRAGKWPGSAGTPAANCDTTAPCASIVRASATILRRIDDVEAAAEHRDRAPARGERAAMRRGVDAAGQAAHDRHAAPGKIGGQALRGRHDRRASDGATRRWQSRARRRRPARRARTAAAARESRRAARGSESLQVEARSSASRQRGFSIAKRPEPPKNPNRYGARSPTGARRRSFSGAIAPGPPPRTSDTRG